MERLPKKNLTAKVIALIMAIILWVYVMNEQNPLVETSMEIPLEVRNLSNSVIAIDIPERVKVKVRGPRSLIVGLSSKDIKSYIDLKGLSDGRNTVKVNTTIPANVEVVEVNPENINFRLDSIASRQIPVEVNMSGSPAPGTVLGKFTYNLTHVTVEGPTELLSTATKVIANVDITGKNADYTVTEYLQLVDEKGKKVEGLTISPGQVSVSLSFASAITKKVVPIRVNTTGVVAKNVTLNPITIDPLQLEISGDAKLLASTEFIYTEPINLSSIEKNTEIEVKLQAREGVTFSKNTVMVNITVVKK